MKAETDLRANLRPHHFDGRDYALMVTVRADNGLVEIQHQPASDDVADRQMARLAAQIIDQVGAAAVAQQADGGVRIQAPPRGTALLACRCGRVLDDRDMRRKKRRPTQSHLLIQPITCPECAT